MKKFLSILLAIMLLLSATPVFAESETVTKDNFYDYFSSGGELLPTDADIISFQGDFSELSVPIITLNKTVNITSDNAVFNGTSFLITADGVSIDGLTITQTGEYAVKVSGAKNVTLSNNTIHHTKSDTDAVAVNAESADGLKVTGNTITYTGDASERKNLPIFVNNSSSVIVSDNSITVSIPSVDTEYDSSTWTALPPRSAGAEFIDSPGVRFTGNILNITSSGENGYYPAVYGLYFSTSDADDVCIQNNVIGIDGPIYVYAITMKAPAYLISGNALEINSEYYGCAMLLQSPVTKAVVQNNSIDVKAKTEAVGVYDTILNDNNFGDNSILNNEIVLESESTTGVLLDSWMGSVSGDFLLSENTISAKGNSLCGISLFAAKNAVITGNSVTLQDDTEGDSTGNYTDPEGKRWSCGMITDNATVTGNTVNSTGLGICARNDAGIKNNTVYAGYSYAVDVNGGDALVTDNLLMAKTLIGDDAVCNADIADVHNNTHAHNYVSTTVQPTCTEKGEASDVCSYCGDKTNAQEIAALGHDFGNNEKVCKRCNVANPNYKEPAPVLTPEEAAMPTEEKTEELIKKTNTDKKDVSGSAYAPLKLKATTKKTNITISWKAVSGADGYIIYAAPCGNKLERAATVANPKAVKYTFKKLKKGKYYKYIVVAYKKTAAGNRIMSKSKSVHCATAGGKKGNPTGIKLKKTKITLKKGKKTKIKATLQSKGKVATHIAKFRYESSNKKIATVDKNGNIKAKKKGTVTIYVYAQNGLCRTIKVKVK